MAEMGQGCLSKSSGAVSVTVTGRVQGVGFRPFISLAGEFAVSGTVQNNMDGVRIHTEGMRNVFGALSQPLEEKRPGWRVDDVIVEKTEPRGFRGFQIIESDRKSRLSSFRRFGRIRRMSCGNAGSENFRYHYPLINCTVRSPLRSSTLPYDRPYTSMKEFAMCEKCSDEYTIRQPAPSCPADRLLDVRLHSIASRHDGKRWPRGCRLRKTVAA